MRRFLIVLLILVTVNTSGLTATANSELKVYVKGEFLESDTPPLVVKGITMVPIRAIAEAIGVSVDWYQDKQEIVLMTDRMVILHIGNKKAKLVSQIEIELDVAPFIYEGRVYIPLRFVCECFNMNVVYDATDKTILIEDMIQEGWFIDKKNNYKIEMFKDWIFNGRGFYIEAGRLLSYDISTTPFYSDEDLSMPVLAFRESERITPYKNNVNQEVEDIIKSLSEKDKFEIVEKTGQDELIKYEYDEGGWTNRHRIVYTYIKYDQKSILASTVDGVDTYFNQYKDEIIENLKTIQEFE